MQTNEHGREFRLYLIGLMLSLILSGAPFTAVAWHMGGRAHLIWLIAAAAVVQIVVQFRTFLHIDLSKSKRDDLQLILFSILITVLVAGGTIWIIANQYNRMM